MTRYGLRFSDASFVPLVEVTQHDSYWDTTVVVARRYGFTSQHAYSRALRWARRNGDPR